MYISLTACPTHEKLVREALHPDAPLALVEEYIEQADDCPACLVALAREGLDAVYLFPRHE